MRTPASTSTGMLRRTLTGAVLPLLAATLLLALSPAAGAQVPQVLVIKLSESTKDVCEIVSDDCVSTTKYTVKLSTAPTSEVTVSVVSGDNEIATVDTDAIIDGDQGTLTFTTENWYTKRTVVLTAKNDDVDNADDERSVTVTNTPSGGGFTTARTVEVTVYDDDVATLTFTPESIEIDESGDDQKKTYTVQLATQPTGSVIVDVASEDTTVATVSPALLTFTPTNYETAQTVTVTGVDDKVARLDRKVKIIHTPSGGGYGSDETGKLLVIVNDGGTTTPKKEELVFSPTQPVVVEGEQATYTVKLNTKPMGTVRLELSRNPSDYLRFSPTHLTFTRANWDTPQSVTVTGIDDEVDNDERKTTITHQPIGGGYDVLKGKEETKLEVGLRDNDTAGLVLSRPTLRLVDEGTTGSYTVKLNSQPTATDDVTVAVAVAPTDKEAIKKVSPASLTFTTKNWNSVQTVTVTAADDDIDNPGSSRMPTITHKPTNGGYDKVPTKSLEVTVVDSDTAGVTLSAQGLSIKEGDDATYTVVLNSEPGNNKVTVTVASDNLAATVKPVSLDFKKENWGTARKITVTGVRDKVDNVGNFRSVNISHKSGDYADDQTVQVRVTDGDPQSQIRLSRTALSVSESGTETYTVKLSEKQLSTVEVVVNVVPNDSGVTVDTDAVEPNDQNKLSFEINKWNIGQTVTVTAAPDKVDNGSRSVVIKHIPDKLVVGADMRVTVNDDDEAEVIIKRVEKDTDQITETQTVNYEVTLGSAPANGDVTVRLVSSDPGVATVKNTESLTFTNGNWSTAQRVTVTPVVDKVDSGARRSVNIVFTPSGGGYGLAEAEYQRVTVTDDDTAELIVSPTELEINEDGGSQSYSLRLATKPTGTVRVTVTSDSSVATVDPNTRTFRPSNWNKSQQVVVTGVRDATRGDRTTTITNTPDGGGYGSAQTARVAVKVLEDMTPGLFVAPATVTVDEGGTTTYSVELNTRPEGDVTVKLKSLNANVATVAPASLTFSATNWDTAQQVTVTGKDDSEVKGDRSATITHQSVGVGVHYYDYTAEVTVTVTEDDAVLRLSVPSVEVAEGVTGRTDTYTVKLDGKPTATVTVAVASADATVATVSPAALIFTVSNYNTAQTVTVTALDDDVDNPGGVRSTDITHTPKGGSYDSVQAMVVTVTVTDDEGFEFSKTAVTVREAGGSGSYTVKLGTAPTASVTVALASGDPSAATVSPAALTFTTANWSTAQSVAVTGVDDDVDNVGDARSTTITHTPSGAGYRTVESVTVTVTDDDAPPSGITLTVEPTVVPEDAPATITVTATPDGTRFATVQTVAVTVGASGDSAMAGTDYAAVDGFTLSIGAGAASGTTAFTLNPVDDEEFEGDETISVSGTASVVPVSGTAITIADDDTITVRLDGSAMVTEGTAANFTVSLVEGTASADIVVTYTVGGTATPGVDYTAPSGSLTILAGSRSDTIGIRTTADNVLDRGETLVVELTSAATPAGLAALIGTAKQVTTTIEDSDRIAVSVDSPTAVEGEPVVFTVTLSGTGMASTVSEPVTVRYATADGTATKGADYAAAVDVAVVVEAGDNEAQFTVATLQDDQAEPDETFIVRLSADPGQMPDGVTLNTTPATATIDDDDQLTATLTGPKTVPEGEAASFMVTLSQPLSETVTLSYATADGSASAGADYAAAGSDAAATIAKGETTATFMVATMGDTLAEANETFSVRLTAVNRPPALATLKTATLPTATVTIVDDDELTVTVSGPGTVVEGSVATFTVTLTGGTGSAPVVVDYTTAGSTATRGKDYTQPSGKLTIAAGTKARNIAIQTAKDKVVDPRETLVVKLTAAGTTGTVAVGTPATATTTIVDPVFESMKRVNQAVLPGVARAAAASTLDALTRRMELAVPGAMPMATADLAGLTNFYRALQANERALQDGSFDLAQVLSGSSFLLPLSSHDGMEGSEISFAIWGSGDYRNFSGGDPDAAGVDWNGSAWSARVAADMRFIDSLLTGVMVSWTGSALDYEDDTGGAGMSGTHGSSLISVHPYLGWTTPAYGLWAAGGLGWGEVQIDDSVADPQSTGLTQWSLGGGASLTLLTTDAMIAGGTTALKLKAEGSLAHAEVEKSDTIDALGVDVNQARALVEASHAHHFPAGGTLTPSLEVGTRFDGGDGETGAGLEVGAGLSYADSGVAVEARGRGLVLHGGNYGEWGLSGLFQYDPGAAGHGLMVSVRPTWGATASGVAGLWEHGTLELLGGNAQAGGRIGAEIGYGLAVFGASGVLTPYAGASLTDAGANSLSIGGRLQVAPAFDLMLEAQRSESPGLDAAPEHGLTLEGAIRW